MFLSIYDRQIVPREALKSMFEVEKRTSRCPNKGNGGLRKRRMSITYNDFINFSYLIFHTRELSVYIYLLFSHMQFISHSKRAVPFT